MFKALTIYIENTVAHVTKCRSVQSHRIVINFKSNYKNHCSIEAKYPFQKCH